MFSPKSRIIVGITTYYNEFLAISIPGLARFNDKISLIIFNDNPGVRLTRRHVRKLGYRGKLKIINTKHNLGQLWARIAILDYVKKHKFKSEWIVFVDDDDILAKLEIPNVAADNFAIIQNMAVIRTRMYDVLRIAQKPDDFVIDNENIFMVRPHIGLAGTLLRQSIAIQMADILKQNKEEISDISASLSFRPPIDMMMWSVINIIAQHNSKNSSPIYMDSVGYVATDIDTADTKYGLPVRPQKNPSQQFMRAIKKYNQVIYRALGQNDEAAPEGQ